MTKGPSVTEDAAAKKAARKQREAEALRTNLKKRKARARALADAPTAGEEKSDERSG